jgi:RimJ/RimL family protein N-acetyltransferase
MDLWEVTDGTLRAFEPTEAELMSAAPALAAAYGDAHNSRMMGQAPGAFTAQDAVAHFAGLRAEGGRPFLLEHAGRLAGDADFRNLTAGAGEFAILIADPAAQGQGLGTRFARLLHAFAFDVLRLQRLYVAIIPENAASRRLFEKLGYRPDDSPVARRHADEPTDLTMSLELAPAAGAPPRICRRPFG